VTPEGVRLDLRVTHQELGDMIGAARESITVALGRLQDQGEIIVRRRTVIIRRMDDQDGTATETA
jgi:CRP/FNR family transcriptional regulator